ncbi:hypothetical protein FRUB_06325 [Fimbriiglobus ruber]|uniref:Uncharacterized protein n=2 Tax=Fimbriiglobus ruber TaxID=1908690 RepID=A0A225DP22_9BACT|nr:hypothetical protein FRUB_06325 [Fimbriiglobus ruber]
MGRAIREVRELLGMKQKEVARLLIEQYYETGPGSLNPKRPCPDPEQYNRRVSDIERGRRNFDLMLPEQMARAFDIQTWMLEVLATSYAKIDTKEKKKIQELAGMIRAWLAQRRPPTGTDRPPPAGNSKGGAGK